jgi:hypothetical protein
VHLQLGDDALYSKGVLIGAQGFLPWGAESQTRFLPRKGLLALPAAGTNGASGRAGANGRIGKRGIGV